MFVASVLLVIGSPALSYAQEDEPETTVSGALSVTDEENPDGDPILVADAEITVTDSSGDEAGSAISEEDGSWVVALPGAGVYDVTLNPDSLPEGVSLRDEDRATLDDLTIRDGEHKRVRFLLGERDFTATARWERMANLTAQGIKFGSIIALAAVGLSLIFGITGLVNFAHGELVAFGALLAWFLNASGGGPRMTLILAGAITLVVACGVGAGFEIGVWRPLRRRQTGRISMLVVAIGISVLLRNLFLVMYGGASRPYRDYTIQRPVELGPLSLTPKDYAITAIALAVLVAVGLGLTYTRTGKALRAVADDRDLAEVSGIDVDRITLLTWIVGAALAALGGILQGVSEAITWDMGFALLLLMFAAVIVGGLGTAFGAMAGGLMIGTTAQVSTYWVSTEFKLVIALGILVIVLMFRPQGILGRAERIG